MSSKRSKYSELISLNKAISSSGLCSRREADNYIEQGRVTINDIPAQIGDRVAEGDIVAVDGEPIKTKKVDKAIYLAFNKPKGITTTTDSKDKTNIISYINYHKRIFPIGRLDKDSEGLILLTNDGDIVNKILRAGNRHEKEYIVSVDKAITQDFILKMRNGIKILGKTTQKCKVVREGNKKFRIILTQGMNRQIRRMCQALDYRVTSLTRIRVMDISLDKIPYGKYRQLNEVEVQKMMTSLSSSKKTEEASKIKHTRSQRDSSSTQNKPRSKNNTGKKSDERKTAKKKSYKDYRKRK